jgi:hypothetical protein
VPDRTVRDFPVSRAEIGLLIDGVAPMVQSQDAEAAPLLRRLQAAYGEPCRCEWSNVGPGIHPSCLDCGWRIGV